MRIVGLTSGIILGRSKVSGMGKVRYEKYSSSGKISIFRKFFDTFFPTLWTLALIKDERFESGPEKSGFAATLQEL